MMLLIDIFRLVIKNLLEKKARLFLTISGIVIGIFTFSLIILLSGGIENAITEQFSGFGLNILGVQKDSGGGGGPPSGSGMTETEISKIKQVVREYKYVSPFIFYSAQYEYNREKQSVVSLGYPDEYWDDVNRDLGLEIEEGRWLRPGDKGVLVLGSKLAKDTFEKEITVGTSLKFNDRSYRVIGILESRGDLFVDNSALTTFDDIKELSGQDTFTGVRISFFDGVNLTQYENAILRKLNPNPDKREFTVSSPQAAIDQFGVLISLVQVVLGIFSSFVLLVGGINVMNTMYSNILERINEISVMKALGGTNSDIRNLFLLESGILGLFGAIIGFMLAYILAETLSFLITNFGGFNVPVYFDITYFLGTVFITTLFAMIFGTF
jgi:putative ABC transport system permease protein